MDTADVHYTPLPPENSEENQSREEKHITVIKPKNFSLLQDKTNIILAGSLLFFILMFGYWLIVVLNI